jgi:hypothetical protein
MLNRVRRSSLVVGCVAAGVSIAFSGTASAAPAPPEGSWDHTWTTYDTGHGGTLYIEEHGDYATICDTAADGKAPVAELYSLGPDGTDAPKFRYTITDTGGYGTCKSVSAATSSTYNLPEDEMIQVFLWIGDHVATIENEYLNDN